MKSQGQPPKTCRHGHTICPECIYITDAARRMSDNLNAHLTFMGFWELRNKWMAFKLADGSSDGVIYDTRQDAIKHQLDERFCCYICFKSLAQGAKPLDCQIFLEFSRQAYDQGMRLHEPEAPQLFVPIKTYDTIVDRLRRGIR